MEDSGPQAIEVQESVSPSAYRRVLGNRPFRRLWYAQFVSGIGDWLVIGFLMPLVTKLSGGSSFAVAGILIAKIVPALVLSSFTGVLVDRFDRRRVMITADLVRAALVLGLVATNSLFVIYLSVLLMETASLFFWPARNALIPRLVGEEDVTTANGLAYTTQQASMLIGLTAAAGILAGFEAIVRAVMAAKIPIVQHFVGFAAPALLGPRAGVILDIFTFLFSAAVITSIKVDARPRHEVKELSAALIGKDVIESFKFLGAHRELRALLVTIGVAILGGGAIVPVGTTYVQQNLTGALPFAGRLTQLRELTATPTTFMLVVMAFGMVAGALVVPRVEKRIRLQMLFAGSVAAFGVSLLGFASVEQYWLASLFGVAAGGCIATVTVAGNSYVAQTTKDEIRGRVFTALESVIRVSLLLSMVVMAPIADLLGRFVKGFVQSGGVRVNDVYFTGSRITLQLSAVLVIAAAVYGFRALSWRECEDATVGCAEADGSGSDA